MIDGVIVVIVINGMIISGNVDVVFVLNILMLIFDIDNMVVIVVNVIVVIDGVIEFIGIILIGIGMIDVFGLVVDVNVVMFSWI